MSFHNPFRLTSNSGDQTIENPSPYVPLIDAGKDPTRTPAKSRRPSRVVVLLLAGLLAVALLVAVALNYKGNRDEDSFPFDKIVVSSTNRPENRVPAVARGVEEGVSAKSFIPLSGSPKCHWTNKMLTWQRTAYHFQPKKNWMNGNFIFNLYIFF